MKHLSIKNILPWLGAFLVSFQLYAQPPRGPFVISPQVNADKSVVFRYLAPQAKQVNLQVQFEKEPVPMVKDSIGIWSVKLGPVVPDIYPYSFNVDGITVMDPANKDFFPNERFKASLVDIPGEKPLVHALKNVPHGVVSYTYYPSVEGSTGSLVVYTPPGYGEDPGKKYPVFYLVSGTTDTEETFFKVGHTNLILDNLIAEGKAVPMIVVMPYGNPVARIAEQTGQGKPADMIVRDGDEAIRRAALFERDLLQYVLPFIHKNYSAIDRQEGRAIGGFSRGGGQTLRVGFGNMDKFSWICCYSAYLSNKEMEERFKSVVENPTSTNKQLRLLWISVGRDDFLFKQTEEFMAYLKEKNINYKSLLTPGGHTWMNVRNYVAETAQLLFK